MTFATKLILGGARSGKSRFAEQCAINLGLRVTYVATAQATDAEMQFRIEQHRQQRPNYWQTVEVPIHLGKALEEHSNPEAVILVDCITLWLSQILFSSEGELSENVFQQEKQHLLQYLQKPKGPVVLVSNEVGSGIVAQDAVTRRFVDEAGWLNQAIAAVCNEVVLVTAGLPHYLKQR